MYEEKLNLSLKNEWTLLIQLSRLFFLSLSLPLFVYYVLYQVYCFNFEVNRNK